MNAEQLRKKLFTEDGIPKCAVCGTRMKLDESKNLKTKGYVWKLDCVCTVTDPKLKNLRMSLG